MAPEADARLLVVDDEPYILDTLTTALRFIGYRVETAASGHQALRAARDALPDLILLDIMLPDLDGLEVARRLRQEGLDTAVIFLSARDERRDVVAGLRAGGDDYVTKPFGLEEVAARVQAVLRRTRGRPGPTGPEVLRYADLEMDLDARRVTRGGREVELSPTEFRLLRYLMLHPERVLTRAQLLEHVWSYHFNGDDTVVATYVSYLRRKLGGAATGGELIRTRRGLGYELRAGAGTGDE
ncbi:response regulator transcription factor [Allostreptomyces psammosilenae]|uniref:response regulator transcription factor n=1 Tax=Allostreptomyces psammosilenae TaxID=1892865 RepID=UPI0015C8B9AA|nr:response regulator transcription factor [Allostreptomyces psammosilenae]